MADTGAIRTRTLGRTGLEVSAVGLGCWPIGGAMSRDGQQVGYTGVHDDESLRAVAAAVDLGITLFDTADAYGAGHSERLLGQALAAHPEVRVATKFGNTIDESTRQLTGHDTSPRHVRDAVHASLRRLRRERIDLYQLHTPDVSPERAAELVEVLEDLVTEGHIAWYGISADNAHPEQVEALAGPHLGVVQVEMNVLDGPPPTVLTARRLDLGVLCRSPLAMGLLGGRHTAGSRVPDADVRARGFEWLRWFRDGVPAPEFLERLESVREVLTRNGRSLAQGALAWIWAEDDRAVPLPGFRTVAHVTDTAGALRMAPLPAGEHDEIEYLLGRPVLDEVRR
jgi:aryl-alcohol dehydrogenase-like predicted oxidoreductase